jgi:phosphate transport system permease protein
VKAKSLTFRKAEEKVFVVGFLGGIAIALASLAFLLGSIIITAAPVLRWSLLTNLPSVTDSTRTGFAVAIVGTLWILAFTTLFSLPLGIAAGVYLEEYAGRGRVSRILQAGVANLAGVPSVVFGLLGLALFVRPPLALGPTVIAGALTLTILVFPYVVIMTQEAVRAVPTSLRDGALALGATKWQATRRQLLPAATPGILTGAILAAARTIGETAPLIVIGAVFTQHFIPYGPTSFFIALPIQIYGYIGLPEALPSDPLYTQRQWRAIAAAGILILLGILFAFNFLAIIIRNRLQRYRM